MPKNNKGFYEVIHQRVRENGGSNNSNKRRPMALLEEATHAIIEGQGNANENNRVTPSSSAKVKSALLQLRSPIQKCPPMLGSPANGSYAIMTPVRQSPRSLQANAAIEANRVNFAISLISVADWHMSKKEYAQAHQTYEKCLFMLDRSMRCDMNLLQYARVLEGLGSIYEKQEQLSVAHTHYREADKCRRRHAELLQQGKLPIAPQPQRTRYQAVPQRPQVQSQQQQQQPTVTLVSPSASSAAATMMPVLYAF